MAPSSIHARVTGQGRDRGQGQWKSWAARTSQWCNVEMPGPFPPRPSQPVGQTETRTDMEPQGGPKTCPACGLLSPPSALRCDCGLDFRTLQGGQPSFTLRGISGWLILVAVGLCVSAIHLTDNLFQMTKTFDAAWRVLTTPDSPSYHWLGAPLLVGEVLTGIIFLGWSLLLIYLFFSKKKSFPRSVIFFMVVSSLVVLIDVVTALMIPALGRVSGEVAMTAIVPVLISAAIWIPYFSKSKRVHATFIE